MYTAPLPWKWNLLPKRPESDIESFNPVLGSPSPTEHDQLYLGRGYEHHLKTELIENWTEWIVEDMRIIRLDAQNDELDSQLAWEWTRRELSLVVSSIKLESILKWRMEECLNKVAEERKNGRLKEWMWSEFVIGQRKRLEKEREQTKERMEREMKGASERAEREGRPWKDQEPFHPRWEAALKFIDKQWSAGIEGGHSAPENAVSELENFYEAGQATIQALASSTRK